MLKIKLTERADSEILVVGLGLAGKKLQIDMTFVDGPLKHFSGQWLFIPLRDDACKIDFKLQWEFKSTILDKVIGPVFSYIAGTFVDCFVKRAEETP